MHIFTHLFSEIREYRKDSLGLAEFARSVDLVFTVYENVGSSGGGCSSNYFNFFLRNKKNVYIVRECVAKISPKLYDWESKVVS